MKTESTLRFVLTALLVLVAVVLAYFLWKHYMYSPWTRDGRIRAEVVQIAPDVSGLVTAVKAEDNQFVRQGDVLLEIDPSRYRLALAQAEANLAQAEADEQAAKANIVAATAAAASRKADYDMYHQQAERRVRIPMGTVVSTEERTNSVSTARSSEATWRQAQASLVQAQAALKQAQAGVEQRQAELGTARLNLQRTEVRAPVDGYATNVEVRVGDYATAGSQKIALVDSHSYYLYGYFEETKLPHLRIGDAADIRLMAGGIHLKGIIIGVARGITDRDNPTGNNLLANVNPTFNWVRLAQRVPVRIAIDPEQMPKGVVLAAGMTATVVVHPDQHRDAPSLDSPASTISAQ